MTAPGSPRYVACMRYRLRTLLIVLAVMSPLLAGVQLLLLPALQRPTISPLADDGWVAVNTVLEEKVVRDLMPRLKANGAQGIVEYPLNKIIE